MYTKGTAISLLSNIQTVELE